MGWVCTIIALFGMTIMYERLQKSRDAHEKTLRDFIKYIEDTNINK